MKTFYILTLLLFANSFSQNELNVQYNPDTPRFNNAKNESVGNINYGYPDLTQIVSLDNTIDSLNYSVGPGDVFSLSVWGVEKKQFSIIVSPEGSIILPMLGVIKVSGLSLCKAKEILTIKIGEIYKTSNFSIVLEQLRSFKTYVSGEVKYPASITVNGCTRISDIITAAGGLNDLGKKRGIEIYNENSKTTTYADIQLSKNSSNFSKNPYINEGDRIYVPPRKDIITVSGRVVHGGTYDYMSGDYASDIISLAGGYTRTADSNKIYVYQYQNQLDTFIVMQANHEMAKTIKIFPNDRIVVGQNDDFQKEQSVEISGEIQNPGVYPIIEGKTHLSEIIEHSGGLTSSADITMIQIIKSDYLFPGEHLNQKLKLIPSQIQYPEEKKFLFSNNIENNNSLSFDFSKYSANNEYDIILEKNDRIVIPKKASYVKVIGSVIRPGIIAFSEGKDVLYYVQNSGGFSANAKRLGIKIIKNEKKTEFLKSTTEIGPGDLIWIPEKRYVDLVQQTKDWVLFISAIATTLLTFLTLRDQIQ